MKMMAPPVPILKPSKKIPGRNNARALVTLFEGISQEVVREQTDLLRTSLIGHIFRLFASNNQKI